MPDFEIAAGSTLSSAAAERIKQGLRDHNAAAVGEAHFSALHVYARDSSGQLIGGLVGATYWRWLHVESLWVAETERRRGYGSHILKLAEAEALDRNCSHAFLDTFTFQARPLYERLGYRCVGTARDFPAGHERYFMVKILERVLEHTKEPEWPSR